MKAIKPLLRRLVVAIAGPVLRRVARLRIALAGRRASPAGRRLLTVVARTLADDFTAAERDWMQRIETMRAALAISTEPITLVDYGAGAPGDTRSAEEMRRGRVSQSTVGALCRLASKPPFWARLLFAVVREYRPRRGLELGTCLAVSASYQGAALLLNGAGGTLHTLEGAESLATRSQQNLAGLGLTQVTVVPGRFDQTLAGVLQATGPLDYAFIDGHHDEQATIAYFHQLLPALTPDAVLVFDDISWSPGMRRAWATILRDDRVRTSIGLRAVGICVLGPATLPRQHLDLFLP